MRSKEVEEKIHMLKSYAGMTHKQTDNQGRPKLDQAIDIVLSYIYELEKEIKEIEFDLTSVYMSGFYDGEKKYKDKIRDKIKVLEGCIEEFKPQGYIEGELKAKIEVLKELLEGE